MKTTFLILSLISFSQFALADAGDFSRYAGYYQLISGDKCSDQFELVAHERDNSLDFILYNQKGEELKTNSIDMDQEGKKILTDKVHTAYYGIYQYTYTKFEQDDSKLTWYQSYKQVDRIGDRDRSRTDWKKVAQLSFTQEGYRTMEGDSICNYKKVSDLRKHE